MLSLKYNVIRPVFDSFFLYIVLNLLKTNNSEFEFFIGLESRVDKISFDDVVLLFTPDYEGYKPVYSQYKLPVFIVMSNESNNKEYGKDFACIGMVDDNALSCFKEEKIKVIEYKVSDYYAERIHRQALFSYATNKLYSIDRYFRRNYANGLLKRLNNMPTGKDNFQEYEVLVKDIFDFILDDCNGDGELQKQVSNKSFRFDICYYTGSYNNYFWNKIKEQTGSNHLLIECKNSSESSELGKGIAQIEKYFSSTNLGYCAILTIRNKSQLHKMKHYSKLIERKDFFLLVLDDKDLMSLIAPKDNVVIINKGVHDRTSGAVFFELMAEARLVH